MVAAYFIACLPAHFDVPPSDGGLHGYLVQASRCPTNLYLKTGDNFSFINMIYGLTLMRVEENRRGIVNEERMRMEFKEKIFGKKHQRKIKIEV